MKWKAYLEGDSWDLDTLIQMFPEGSTFVIARDVKGEYLQSERLDTYVDASERHDEAQDLVRQVNGVRRVINPSYRPVRLVGRYEDGTARDIQIVVADSIEVRSHASVTAVMSGGVASISPPPPGRAYLDLADANSNIAEALSLMGRPSSLGWVELYKLYEIVRDDVGQGQKGLVAQGWLSEAELSAFTASANRPDVSGENARHARRPGGAPKYTMTLDSARDLVSRLLDRWLDWHL